MADYIGKEAGVVKLAVFSEYTKIFNLRNMTKRVENLVTHFCF